MSRYTATAMHLRYDAGLVANDPDLVVMEGPEKLTGTQAGDLHESSSTSVGFMR